MFIRAELKKNAKKIFSKNYWWIVLVTIILGLVTGGGTSIDLNYNNIRNNRTQIIEGHDSGISEGIIDEFGNLRGADGYSYDNASDIFLKTYNHIYNTFYDFFSGIPIMLLVVYGIVFIIVLLALCGLSIFVLNPLYVGCRRWFLKNRKEKPEMGEIAYAMRHGYLNTVKIMFCKNLFVILWSLLFIIPGIVKKYEYRMIPYLLAENPEMNMSEAFSRSKTMMKGNKWDAFVLDLSFFGWLLISGFCFGLLNILFVAPYIELTETELYVCLCQGRERYVSENNLEQNIV